MAEVDNVQINIDVNYNVKNANEAVKTTEVVKENAKETNKTFGIGDTQMGKFWNSFKTGGQVGINTMKTLKGAIIATGIGALVVLVMGLVEWFKKTETGSDLLAKGMKILGQIVKEGPVAVFNALKIVVMAILTPMRTAISTFKNMKDVLSGKQSLSEAMQNIKNDVKAWGEEIVETAGKFKGMAQNIAEAAKLADKWDALDDARRDRKIKDKEIDAEIADLRERASDADTELAEKATLLAKAQSLLSEQHKVTKADKEEEIRLIEEELKLYPDNAEWIEKLATAKGELADIDRAYSKEKKTIGKQAQSIEKEIARNAVETEKEKAEEIKKANEELEKVKKSLVEKARAEWKRIDEMEQGIKLLQIDKNKRQEIAALTSAFNEKLAVAKDAAARESLEFQFQQDKKAIEANAAQQRELESLKQWLDEKNAALEDGSLEGTYIQETYNLKKQEIDDKYLQDKLEREKAASDRSIQIAKEEEEAKKAIRQQSVQNLESIGKSLQIIAGKNRAIAYAGLLIEKAVAIGSVIAQTAIANAKMIATFPITAGMPWVAINTAAGALSVAAIIKQTADSAAQINSAGKDIPKHQMGTKSAPGGISLVGEGGPELIDLPKGTTVYSNNQSRQMLEGMNILPQLLDALSRMTWHITVGRQTALEIVETGNEEMVLNAKFVKQ